VIASLHDAAHHAAHGPSRSSGKPFLNGFAIYFLQDITRLDAGLLGWTPLYNADHFARARAVDVEFDTKPGALTHVREGVEAALDIQRTFFASEYRGCPANRRDERDEMNTALHFVILRAVLA
jgi:hypothetical protein